jgi:hypothetical protein
VGECRGWASCLGPGGDQTPAGPGAGACDAPGGARTFKSSHPVLFRMKAEVLTFIDSQRERFAVSRVCALYGVTRAGFCARRCRVPRVPGVRTRPFGARSGPFLRTAGRPTARGSTRPSAPEARGSAGGGSSGSCARRVCGRREAVSGHPGATHVLHEHPESPARWRDDGRMSAWETSRISKRPSPVRCLTRGRGRWAAAPHP